MRAGHGRTRPARGRLRRHAAVHPPAPEPPARGGLPGRGHGLARGDESVEHVTAATAYVAGTADLIRDTLPTLSRLDDAIVADTVLRALAGELDAYADFCDARRAAHAAGDGGFDRTAWRDWRDAEARARHQARRVREGSYLRAPTAGFRVH